MNLRNPQKLGRPKNPEKRQAILQAAAELFPAKGFSGVSMMDIAEKANVSKLTLYSHFVDKEDLYTQTVCDCCEQQLPASSFKPAPGLDLEQALRAIGNGFLDLIMDEKALTLHRMIIQQSGADGDHAGGVILFLDELHTVVGSERSGGDAGSNASKFGSRASGSGSGSGSASDSTSTSWYRYIPVPAGMR